MGRLIGRYFKKAARPVARTARIVTPLFGGPVGGRRPIYLNDRGPLRSLGDDGTVAAVFNPSVEQWRADVEAQMGTLPISFLLMWIQVESNGNPCSYTSLAEAGVFQLMNGDNMVQGKTTMAEQHPVPPCTAGVQTTAYRSSLTDDQAYQQVRGGIEYVNYCRARVDAWLGQYGYAGQPGWSSSDWSYWAMVKMVHVAPAKIPGMLSSGLAGGGVPADWDAMMQNVSGIPTSWTDNARKVGLYGQGGGTVFNRTYLIYGGMAIGVVVLAALMARSGRQHAA